MKTILVLSPHPDFAEVIRAGLNPEEYRIVHRIGVEEAEPLLMHRLASACILDVDLLGVQGVWAIERLRRRDSKCPIIAYTADSQSEWEEEAFLHGVTHVLTKPVRIRLLNSLLERQWSAPKHQRATQAPMPAPSLPQATFSHATESFPSHSVSTSQTLGVLRDFSSILTHSLNAEAMLKQFLLFLREIFSVNRAAIFLNRPIAAAGDTMPADNSRGLRATAAIGISSDLLENFELSLDAGIGGQLVRLGRILRRDSDEARADVEAQKEFELLGAQVAVPVLDRETIVGVAVFDGRVTGEPLVNTELELIFHLLGQVGLALRNIWLHDQLASNNEMMADVLRELSSACVVVGRDLKMLHANKSARRHFGHKNRRTGELEFSDLPQALGAKIYQVLHTGAAIGPFRYEPENSPGTVYNITVVPFQRGNSSVPVSALLTAEDLTQTEQLRHLEVEAANLRLIKAMADRLAHEIGNAMVPLSTHQQLLGEKFRDAEFRKSLDHRAGRWRQARLALAQSNAFSGARRANRNRRRFPSNNSSRRLIRRRASINPPRPQNCNVKTAANPSSSPATAPRSNTRSLKSCSTRCRPIPRNPESTCGCTPIQTRKADASLEIEVQDNGAGFTTEAAKKAPTPFFTTRNVGLGLGLAVSRKIIETHHGRLEIVPPQAGKPATVRVSLPMDLNTGVRE